jgi:hypothetical protein
MFDFGREIVNKMLNKGGSMVEPCGTPGQYREGRRKISLKTNK